MKHNKELSITIGGSRKETNWKPQRIMWQEFVERLRTPVESEETQEEYKRLTKAQQDDLKDVGGFVGGLLNGSRRKSGSVKSRCLITLDMDNIPAGGTEDVLKRVNGLECAFVVYSTRKHEGAAPRLRVILPTDRELVPDEYEPIARKIASLIGIDQCDPTTFQCERFMYWPSCCHGAEYVFQCGDKPFLSADGVLSMYQDWRDIKEWAEIPGIEKRIERNLKRQQDPTEKNGIIGAFCRVYDVPAVIGKYLPDIYEPCEGGRYTYAAGSTSAGAVLYENGKFLYSNHATDPASGKLLNAFDLVRVHKFVYLDEEAKPDTPSTKLPSYSSMREFAFDDPLVKKEYLKNTFPESGGSGTGWLDALELDSKGNPAKTAKNIMLILENDPRLKGCFQKDVFARQTYVLRQTPWKQEKSKRELADEDLAGLRIFLESEYHITGAYKIQDAFDSFIDQGAIHSVREYIKGLKWDGVKRIDTAFIDFLGADDTPYIRKSARKIFCAGIARIFTPGIKFDYLPALIGAQGIGKSTFIRIMGKDWYSESLKVSDMKDKTAAEKLLGSWVIEISEMDGMNTTKADTLKSFLSAQQDKYRPAYGRETVTNKRQCIIIGTSNEREFLKDDTGNRRFWPIDVGKNAPTKNVFTELPDVIDQMWAEAYMLWILGESLYPDAEMAEEAEREQEAHRHEDPRKGIIEEFLKQPVPVGWYSMSSITRLSYLSNPKIYTGETMLRDKICALEIWVECFHRAKADMTQRESRQINGILSEILKDKPEWMRNNLRFGADYGAQRGFSKCNGEI